MPRIKGWSKADPKTVHIFSIGAREHSVVAWESETPNKWGSYPAISVVPNIGGGYNVQFYGINRGNIKSFKTKDEAIKYAINWMRKHPRG